ncbi:MAG: hypothetical protein AAF290_17175 [Pseudomonadota bacterium]
MSSNKTIFVFLSALILGLGTFTSANAQLMTLHTLDDLPKIKWRMGYVLIGVDNGDTNAFLTVRRLEHNGRTPRRSKGELTFTPNSYRIDLSGREAGFYLLGVPAGLYQITEVNYPYFDLPFRLSTTDQSEWRFFVEEGKTNYIGQLIVANERSRSTLDVNLLNRLATQWEQIHNDYQTLLAEFPLVSGVGSRDDFPEFLTAQ